MGQVMDTLAVVLEGPERLALARLSLCEPAPEDVVVDIEWSGISTGTERLLWSGRMPPFPGMGYPLVPGYESVGRISALGAAVAGTRRLGERVFVPGARCYGEVRGLFGGAASRVVVPAARVTTIDESLGESAVLLALAATARHALAAPGARPPELIVGHGVLGRLLARVALAEGAFAPTVWERNAARARSDGLYSVVAPDDDPRRDYRAVYDVSGDAAILDGLLDRLAPGGEIVLAGFYPGELSFDFPKAFMREARIRIAAEWKDSDMKAVLAHIDAGRLSLDGLVTHRHDAADAAQAYRRAFEDTECLKMILDWRHAA
jgi:3-hydroxyethyl bacteriochlorophyllide a dehydrogenase